MRVCALCGEVLVDSTRMELLPEDTPMSPPPLSVWHDGGVEVLSRAFRARSALTSLSELAPNNSQLDHRVRWPVRSVPRAFIEELVCKRRTADHERGGPQNVHVDHLAWDGDVNVA